MTIYESDDLSTMTLPLYTRFLQKILFPSKKLSENEKRKLAVNISNKTILITGASYGIGEQLAYLLAGLSDSKTNHLDKHLDKHLDSRLDHYLSNTLAQGHDNQSVSNQSGCNQSISNQGTKLILVGRTKEKLQYVQTRINNANTYVKAEIYALDLRDETQLQEFIAYLQTQSVDIFVNNAGQSIKRSVMDSLERAHDYERTISLNYLAPVKLSLSLIPQLKANKGQLINVSALNVLLPAMPEWSAYQASKTAFDQWFCSVTPELFAQGITTSTLYLPLVRTRMIAPTAMYQTAPAMTPKQVSMLIARLINNKKPSFKPWWLYLVEVSSILFKRPLHFVLRTFYRYKLRHQVPNQPSTNKRPIDKES